MSENAASGSDKNGQLVCEVPMPKRATGEGALAPVKLTIRWSEHRLAIVLEGDSLGVTRETAEAWRERLSRMHGATDEGEQTLLVSEQWQAYEEARDAAMVKMEELTAAESRAKKQRTETAVLRYRQLQREYEVACKLETSAWNRWQNDVGQRADGGREGHAARV